MLNPEALLAECAVVTRTYRDTQAQLLVTKLRNVAYGCAAQSGLNTLDGNYERPSWLLQTAAIRPADRILMQGSTCRSLSRRAGACRPEGDETVLLLTPPRPPSVSLDLAGAQLRSAPRSP